MQERIDVRQDGRIAVAIPAEGTTLSRQTAAVITDNLTYLEQGYAPDLGVFFTERQMYLDRGYGWAFGAGHLRRVSRVLRDLGVHVTVHRDPHFQGQQYKPDWTPLRGVDLRHRQDELLATLAALDCGVVVAPTGSGKSWAVRMACEIFKHARIHYVTKSTDVADMTYTELRKHFPLVDRVGGGPAKYKGARIAVVNADSVHRLGGQSDIVLADELHELAAPKYVEAMAVYRKTKMFGFTASLERNDNRHNELESIYGPVVFRMPYQEAQAHGMVMPITVRWVRPSVTRDPGWGLPPGTDRERASVWRNDRRNADIAAEVLRCQGDGQVLVMTKSIEHLYAIRQHLPGFEAVYAEKSEGDERIQELRGNGLIPPDEPTMTPSRRQDARRRFEAGKLRRVVANYVWSTGVDFRHLGLLARADAGGSKTKNTQIPGRVSRIMEGKTGARLIDSWDDFSGALLERAYGRRREYAKNGWSQEGP